MAKKATEQNDEQPEEQVVETTEAKIPDPEIIAKMRAGLTREQAVEVISNQRIHDAALEK